MTDEREIRELLGRALEDEPPLRLDRDEVFRQGRKRLRRRRGIEAGAVVAGVVAIAVGAATFTGLLDRDPKGVPAADGGQPTARASPQVMPEPTPAAPPSVAPGASDRHAEDMTTALVEFLPGGLVLEPVPGMSTSGFTAVDGMYELSADIVGPDGRGALHLVVAPAKADDQTGCTAYLAAYARCELVGAGSGAVAIATEQLDGGEWRYLAFVARPDGTSVTGTVSNLSGRERMAADGPSSEEPVLTRQELAALVRLPGLSYY